MTNKEAIEVLTSINKMWSDERDEFNEALELAIKALEQTEVKGDLISREALIKAFNEAQVEFDEYYKGLGRAKVITDNAPTVIPTFGMFRAMLCETCQAYATNKAIAKLADEYTRPQDITNADLFKQTFGLYATEVWSMSETRFLEWLNRRADMRGEET